MKILVTGALGHIGSKLIRQLPNHIKNAEITLIDNLSTQRYSSLFNLKKKNYKFKNIDISIPNKSIENIFNKQDIVIHLAAITDATSSFDKPKEVERNNLRATKIVSEMCSQYNIKLIFISSTSVYGSQSGLVDEDCSKKNLLPQSPYAKTKLKEEEAIKLISKKNNLKYVICRFGTIYGTSEGMRFHTAVNKFCWQAVMGEPITIWKTALNQKRPYLYLEDAVNSLIHIIKKNLFNGEVYNILSDNLTVSDVVKEIKKEIKNVKLKMVNHEIMNQLSYEVDNKKIKNTKFKFNGNIKIGVVETIKLLQNSNYIIK